MREHLFNSEFYKKLFSSDPSFENIDIESIDVHGFSITLTIHLYGIRPEVIPKIWKEPFNTTVLRVTFDVFSNLSISSHPPYKNGSLTIEKISDDNFKVSFINQTTKVYFECKFISVGSVAVLFKE
jgi:hypothetical protein